VKYNNNEMVSETWWLIETLTVLVGNMSEPTTVREPGNTDNDMFFVLYVYLLSR